MEKLLLPSITGKFGSWRYYQVIFKVKNLVEPIKFEGENPIYRVKTVDEVKEVYTEQSLNEKLQRVFEPKRLEPIKNYLTKQKDKYINNITLAIFGGEPEWLPIGLKEVGIFDELNEDKSNDISKSFGFIRLTGDETIFVLDGQHRIKGLREAVNIEESLLDQDIAVTLISHQTSSKGKRRTRRLFSTINRHAVPVSFGENILLDEDDLSAIIVRELIEDFKLFKDKDVIALNKTANLNLPSDSDKFSTVISLWNINEILIDNKSIYPKFEGPKRNLVKVRPSEEVIKAQKKKIFNYWSDFFSLFQYAKNFLKAPDKKIRKEGGPFYLRPIGQEIIAKVYQHNSDKFRLLNKIEPELNSDFWKFVLWDPHKGNMLRSKSHAYNYLRYHLNMPLTTNQLNKLKDKYRKNSGNEKLSLPKQFFSKNNS